MRTLPFRILTIFGAAITKEEYLHKKIVYKTVGKEDILFNISDVVYGLASGDYTTLYLKDGRKYTYCRGFSKVALWFPINFFDCYSRGELINKTLIKSHTGRYHEVVSIFLPLDWISEVSKKQRSRYLDLADKEILIKKVTTTIEKLLIRWRKSERKKRINY